MTLSLSFDHRLVDGEQAARFLADLGGLLGDPALAMLRDGGTESASAHLTVRASVLPPSG